MFGLATVQKKRVLIYKQKVKTCLLHALDLHDVGVPSVFFLPGATRTKDARELLYARQKVVVTTKAFGLQAIDLVYIDYKDVEGLRRQAREGALMGFTGKSFSI